MCLMETLSLNKKVKYRIKHLNTLILKCAGVDSLSVRFRDNVRAYSLCGGCVQDIFQKGFQSKRLEVGLTVKT